MIFDTRDAAINALLSQEVSAYAANIEFLKILAKEHPELEVVLGEFGQEEFGIAVTPSEVGLLDLVNQTIQDMVSDGTLAALKSEAGFNCASSECPSPNTTYIAQPGDTLGGIARQVYGNFDLWTCIAQANEISDPPTLSDGLSLKIPSKETCLSRP